MDYSTFFKTATGHPPYLWQCRLAENSECQSRLVDIPDFNSGGFATIKSQADLNSYKLSRFTHLNTIANRQMQTLTVRESSTSAIYNSDYKKTHQST